MSEGGLILIGLKKSESKQALAAKTAALATCKGFNVPDGLRVGTLDSLMALSDDLAKMDTVSEGRLTTGGVDIGAAITALTAQSYAGWYISGSGANGHCDKACQDVGLICTETEFAKHIHEVDECAEVAAIVLSHYKGHQVKLYQKAYYK